MMREYQFIHISMFKRDPFHIMIFKEKIYEMGGLLYSTTGRESMFLKF